MKPTSAKPKVYLIHHGGCNSFEPGCDCEPEQLALESVKPLRSDQGARLTAARRCGYLVLSPCKNEANWTLQARWSRHCEARSWPCVTVRRGVTFSSIDLELVDGQIFAEDQMRQVCDLMKAFRQIKALKKTSTATMGPSGVYIDAVRTAWAEHCARRVVNIATGEKP